MKETTTEFTNWDIVKPFYWILRTFGLATFSIDGEIANGKIKSGIWDGFHLLAVFAVQFYIFYINVTMDLSLSRTQTVLIDTGAHIIEIFNGFNVLLGTCYYTFYRKKVWGVFRKCYEFDKEVAI